MYELQLAYYKGRNKKFKKRFVTAIIKLFTGKYSHVELVFPDELYQSKNSFSSSGWDGGVRYKRINFSHVERWTFQSLGKFSEAKIKEVRSWCDTIIGKKYATIDVIQRFGFGKEVNSKDAYWCSEACAYVLNMAMILQPPISENLAPTRMYYRVRRNYKQLLNITESW